MSAGEDGVWRAVRKKRPRHGWFVSCGVTDTRPKVIRWGLLGKPRAHFDLWRSRRVGIEQEDSNQP